MAEREHTPEPLRAEAPTLSFRARALAQAHPLSATAHRFVKRIVARERVEQPQAEIGIWAGHALTVGYCLRKLEEVDAQGSSVETIELDFEEADSRATTIAAAIRTSEPDLFLLEPTVVVDLLDELIAGEIDRRLDHWKGTVSVDTWAELEEYIAWWVIKGYSLRVAESGWDAQRLD